MSTGDSQPSDEQLGQPPSSAPAKTGEGATQDVFMLTGTTFAGGTDMNSTAGPTPNDTRPGTVLPIVGISEDAVGEDGTIELSTTARHERLLVEAELRAEHQLAARGTMLDLAHALDQSNQRARELGVQLRNEYDNSAQLRRERDRFEALVDALHEKEEKREADLLIEKAMASGNKMVFGMLLEKSREAYSFEIFDTERKGDAAVGSVSRETTMAGQGSEALANSDLMSKREAMGLNDLMNGAIGDRVTIGWVVKLWWREVESTRARKAKETEVEERRLKAEAEARRIEEEKEKAVEAVRKINRQQTSALDRLTKQMEEHQKTVDKLEKELRDTKEAAAREASASKAREEKLKEELALTKTTLYDTQATLKQLEMDYEASQESLRKADEAFAAERLSLKGVIRQVSSQLHEAMVLAKHMRETALKAKRDAAGSVSPSKFAELIAQLEEMKNQLSVLSKDCDHKKDTNEWLCRQLDKNKRQLELERQFLPLLRKVRGPVGTKVKGTAEEGSKRKDVTQMQAPANAMPALLAPGASPNKLRNSQSMGALNDTRAATAGGPLGGGRTGGFQEDQNRFASSLGFAGSGQGTPLRG